MFMCRYCKHHWEPAHDYARDLCTRKETRKEYLDPVNGIDYKYPDCRVVNKNCDCKYHNPRWWVRIIQAIWGPKR